MGWAVAERVQNVELKDYSIWEFQWGRVGLLTSRFFDRDIRNVGQTYLFQFRFQSF